MHEGKEGDILRSLPEELRGEAEAMISGALAKVEGLKKEAYDAFAKMPQGLSRKEFSAWARKEFPRLQFILFALLDGKKVDWLYLSTGVRKQVQ
jgi:hypothetical protein